MSDCIDKDYVFTETRKDFTIKLEITDRVYPEATYDWNKGTIFKRLYFINSRGVEVDFPRDYNYLDKYSYFMSMEDCFIASRFCNLKRINTIEYDRLCYDTEKTLLEDNCKILKHILRTIPDTLEEAKIQFDKCFKRKLSKWWQNDCLIKLNKKYLELVNVFKKYERDWTDDEDCDEREVLHIAYVSEKKIDFMFECERYLGSRKNRIVVYDHPTNSSFLKAAAKEILSQFGIKMIVKRGS